MDEVIYLNAAFNSKQVFIFDIVQNKSTSFFYRIHVYWELSYMTDKWDLIVSFRVLTVQK